MLLSAKTREYADKSKPFGSRNTLLAKTKALELTDFDTTCTKGKRQISEDAAKTMYIMPRQKIDTSDSLL
jgi:hypothetical protein